MTRVIFRYWFISRSVIALFPDIPADTNPHHCQSYEHTGQHGAADTYDIFANSRQARPEEYAELLEELKQIGYDDIVIRTRTNQHSLKRRREAIRAAYGD